MFYCKDCGSRVQILLPHLKVVGFPVLSSGSKLGISHVVLVPEQQSTIEIRTQFFCSICKRTLDLIEVVGECSHCFVRTDVSDLSVFPSYPGAYCEEHRDLVHKETGLNFRPLSNSVQTIELKGV